MTDISEIHNELVKDREKLMELVNEINIELPEVEGLEYKHAMLNIADTDLLWSTVKDFYDGVDKDIYELSKLYDHIIDSETRKNYRIKVHSVKSIAGTVGMVDVFVLARMLERYATENNVEKIDQLHIVLISELELMRDRLKVHFYNSGDVEIQKASKALVQPVFDRLLSSVIELDIDAIEEAKGEIRQFTFNSDLDGRLQSLYQAINNMDADRIRVLCDRIIENI